MSDLTVDIPVPILIYGERDRIAGEVWLTNNTGGDVTLTSATLTVDFATPETGKIPVPDNTSMPDGATRMLTVQTGMPQHQPSGTFPAHIDLVTSLGTQKIPATLVIAPTYLAAVAPSIVTLTGVTKAATVTATVVVINRGNTAIEVGSVPDEDLFEVVITSRVLDVTGADLSVAPGPSMAPVGTVTFTNPTMTISPGSWDTVDIKLTMPGTLTANRHYRVLPRIATQRFVVDLLT